MFSVSFVRLQLSLPRPSRANELLTQATSARAEHPTTSLADRVPTNPFTFSSVDLSINANLGELIVQQLSHGAAKRGRSKTARFCYSFKTRPARGTSTKRGNQVERVAGPGRRYGSRRGEAVALGQNRANPRGRLVRERHSALLLAVGRHTIPRTAARLPVNWELTGGSYRLCESEYGEANDSCIPPTSAARGCSRHTRLHNCRHFGRRQNRP